MNYDKIVEFEYIKGDEEKSADIAFGRAGHILECHQPTPDEFRHYLQAEAEEHERRALYYRSMQPYYHENAAIHLEMEAKAFRLMMQRFDEQLN